MPYLASSVGGRAHLCSGYGSILVRGTTVEHVLQYQLFPSSFHQRSGFAASIILRSGLFMGEFLENMEYETAIMKLDGPNIVAWIRPESLSCSVKPDRARL